jgi:hypothetical protein
MIDDYEQAMELLHEMEVQPEFVHALPAQEETEALNEQ